jgi:hypothetical protein
MSKALKTLRFQGFWYFILRGPFFQNYFLKTGKAMNDAAFGAK